MKKYIAILAIMMALSSDASACSICKPIADAWDSMIAYIEKIQCQKEQMVFARNGKYAQCRHGGKHQLANFK